MFDLRKQKRIQTMATFWEGYSIARKNGNGFDLDSVLVFNSFIKSKFCVIGHKYAFLKCNLFLHKIFISYVLWTGTVFVHIHLNLRDHLDHNLKVQKNICRPFCLPRDSFPKNFCNKMYLLFSQYLQKGKKKKKLCTYLGLDNILMEGGKIKRWEGGKGRKELMRR